MTHTKTYATHQTLNSLYYIVCTTTRCNLNCSYCSARKASRKQASLDFEAGKQLLEKIANVSMNFTQIVFHGGEPLMEFDTLSKLIKFTRGNLGDSKTIRLSLQSNLTLLTQEMAEFFKEKQVSVGFSLDGDFLANSKTRKNSDPEKTFDAIMRGVKILKKTQKSVGCICVVSKENINVMDRIMSFFASIKLDGVMLNPAVPVGGGVDFVAEHGVSADEYAKTVISLYERQAARGWPRIDTVDTLIGLAQKTPNLGHRCYPCDAGWSIIAVDQVGNVYPCGRFNNDPNWACGNLLTDDLLTIYNSEKMKKCRTRKQNITQCLSCEFQEICGGGCAASAYYYQGDVNAPGYDCEFNKAMLNWVKDNSNKPT
jgi:uncharacterized protein